MKTLGLQLKPSKFPMFSLCYSSPLSISSSAVISVISATHTNVIWSRTIRQTPDQSQQAQLLAKPSFPPHPQSVCCACQQAPASVSAMLDSQFFYVSLSVCKLRVIIIIKFCTVRQLTMEYVIFIINFVSVVIRDVEYNSDQKDKLEHIHKSSWKLFLYILFLYRYFTSQKITLNSAIYEVHFADRFESPSEGVQSKLWPHYVLLSDNLLTSCRLSHSLCCNPLVASCFQNVPLVSCCVNSTPHFYISMAQWENLKFAGHSAESSITRSVFRDIVICLSHSHLHRGKR